MSKREAARLARKNLAQKMGTRSRAGRGAQLLDLPIELGRHALDEPDGNAVWAPERIKRRSDFLRAAKGKRFYARGLTLQAAPQPVSPGAVRTSAPSCRKLPPRFGFTVTKHSGGAVRRNLIRRRLKEALRLLKPLPALPGYDYVILARPEALDMSVWTLQAELMRALGKIDTHKNPPPIRPHQDGKDSVAGGGGEARRKSSKGRTPKG